MAGQVGFGSPTMNLQVLGDALSMLYQIHGYCLIDSIFCHQSVTCPFATCYGYQIVI